MNLMMRICMLLVVSLIHFTGKAQNFSYTEPVGNFAYTTSKIIGRVGTKIVVWRCYQYHVRNSAILLYNEDMELVHTTSLESVAPEAARIGFINEGSSFQAVLQYKDGDSAVCKSVGFDSSGNIISTEIIDRSSLHDPFFETIQSADRKTFVLLKVIGGDMRGGIAIQYYFFRDDQVVHTDTIILPFDVRYSALGGAMLDADALLIPVNNKMESQASLGLFKINLVDNTSVNTIRNLDSGYLVSSTIRISKNENYYTVAAAWKNDDSGSLSHRGIFLWQLKKDLSDISSDTLLSAEGTLNQCLENFTYLNVSNVSFKGNTANIIVSSTNGGQGHFFFHGPQQNAPLRMVTQSFYAGRVEGIYGSWGTVRPSGGYSSTLPQSTYYGSSKSAPVKSALAILNVDHQNNILWTGCFDETIEDKFVSLTNEYVIVQTENAFHFIYKKVADKNKEALGDIVFDANGKHEVRPIVSMNLKYTYLLAEAVQTSNNELVFPCVIKEKLAFARLTIENVNPPGN